MPATLTASQLAIAAVLDSLSLTAAGKHIHPGTRDPKAAAMLSYAVGLNDPDLRASNTAYVLRRFRSIVAFSVGRSSEGLAIVDFQVNGSRVAYATVRIPARHVEEAKTGRDLALIVADLLR